MERSSGLNLIMVWSCEDDHGAVDDEELLEADQGENDVEGVVSSDADVGGRTLPSLTASDGASKKGG